MNKKKRSGERFYHIKNIPKENMDTDECAFDFEELFTNDVIFPKHTLSAVNEEVGFG